MRTFNKKDEYKSGFLTFRSANNEFVEFKNVEEYLKTVDQIDIPDFNEVIFPNKNRKFFVDIDWSADKTPENDKTFSDRITLIRNIISDKFLSVFKKIVHPDDIIETSSSGQSIDSYKYSCNLIVTQYAIPDQYSFSIIGNEVREAYSDDPNDHFIDPNQFSKRGSFNNRLVGSVKYTDGVCDKRYKTSNAEIRDTIITYCNDCIILNSLGTFKKIESSEAVEGDVAIFKEMMGSDACNHTLREITGGKIHFTRLNPSYCTVCERVHDKDNNLYGIVYEDKYVLNCIRYKRCVAIRYKNITKPPEPLPEIIDKPNKKADEARIEKQLDINAMFTNKKYNLIRAEMKMGKTKKCIEYLENNTFETVCIISFRRTFSAENHKKYKDFVMYSDIKGNLNSESCPKLIIQQESLSRLELGSEYEVIILDEVESIFDQFSSGNYIDYCGALAMFSHLIKKAKKVIAMDANLSSRTPGILSKIDDKFVDNHSKYVNKYNPSHEVKYICLDANDWIGTLYKAVNTKLNVAIFSNSLKEAKSIFNLLQDITGPTKIMLYSSETRESIKRKHFSDINSHWNKYQVVICTPTVSAGISFEQKHFDYIFGYFSDRSCNVEACMQMLGRVRDIKSNRIFIHFPASSRKLKPITDLKEIEQILCSNRTDLINEIGEQYKIGNLEYEIVDNQRIYMRSLRYWISVYNIHFNTKMYIFASHFRNSLRDKAHKVIDVKIGNRKSFSHNGVELEVTAEDINFVKTRRQSNNKELTETVRQEVTSAKVIDKLRYNEIKVKFRYNEDVYEDEIIEFNKYKMVSVVGNCMSKESIDMYYRRSDQLRRFRLTKQIVDAINEYGSWIKAINAIKKKDMQRISKSVNDFDKKEVIDRTHDYKIHYLIYRLFQSFGSFEGAPDIRYVLFGIRKFGKNKSDFDEVYADVLKQLELAVPNGGEPIDQLIGIVSKYYLLTTCKKDGNKMIRADKGFVGVAQGKLWLVGKTTTKDPQYPLIHLV